MTAAAILLAVAIGAFSTSSISFIQQIGVATAAGVLLDAFVVRALLVPALMALLGQLELVVAGAVAATAGAHRPTMSDAVAARPVHHPVAWAWLPVAVLPPLLVLDAALSSDGPAVSVLGVLAAIVACLPLVVRARLPFGVLAPLLTAGIILVLWQLEPGNTVVLIPMVALVELAQRGDRRRTLWVGLAVLPCVVISVLPFANDAAELLSIVVRNVALCLLALAAGDILRSREEAALRRLGEERLRIAREVHDVVAHAMVAINVQAGVAAHLLDGDTEQARAALRGDQGHQRRRPGRPARHARRAPRGRRRRPARPRAGTRGRRRPRRGPARRGRGRRPRRRRRAHRCAERRPRRRVPHRAGGAHQRPAPR